MQSYGINPSESGMMVATNPPTKECGKPLRKSPGGENGVLQTIGFKAGQSKDGVECYDPYNNTESEVTPTIRSNAGVSTAGPLAYGADLSRMRYIVRRLTPTECERLMGLPDGYTIPTGLRRFFDANGEPAPELVAEFQSIFDTFGAIMADYAHTKPPKPKSAKQVADWLKKISDPEICPDSPRYKGDGNGWATNQPRWILCRMLAADGIDPFNQGETL